MIKIEDDTLTDLGVRNLEAKAKVSVANSLERLVDLLETITEKVIKKLDQRN